MFCNHCGAQNADSSRFCTDCGKTITAPKYPLQPGASPFADKTELGPLPASPPGAAQFAPALTELALAPGFLLANRYRILRMLGVGGMGRVYLAEDEKLGVRVAIKVLQEMLSRDPGSVQRLIAEAKLAIQLAHPNVVRVNHFEDGEMLKFLVMEYVEGETLAHKIARDKRLPEGEVRRIAIEICKGLEHAHQKKVIHRDIKPANIILAKNGEIKIADFGIARQCRDSVSRLTSIDDSGTRIYMSPEQLLGKSSEASDIYSLGIVLYEMLTGEPPFQTGDISYQIREIVPDSPAGIGPDLEAIVMKCLEKKPENRFAIVRKLREELDGTAEAKRKEEEARAAALRRAEEELQRAEEKRKAEEARRRKEEERLAEEKRKVEEARRRKEEERLAEEKRKVEEAHRRKEEERLAEEKRKAEEARRRAEEERKQAEIEANKKREEEERRRQEDGRRLEEERKRSAVGLVSIAIALLDRGAFNEAEKKLQEALKLDSASAEARAALDRSRAERAAAEAKRRSIRYLKIGLLAVGILVVILIVFNLGKKKQASPSSAGAGELGKKEQVSPSSAGAGELGKRKQPTPSSAGAGEMEFVSIPAGKFMMGCSPGDLECNYNENPRHEVTISRGFELGKYKVTQGQWLKVMGNNPSDYKSDDRLPVERVDWSAVQSFIAKLNALNDGYRYRLPTEAEWEYAARAGTTGPQHGNLDSIAWYKSNSGNKTHPVGQKQSNGFGLYDMLGNVFEWCADWYSDSYYSISPAVDPKGPSSGQERVLRGQAWNNRSIWSRVSARGGHSPYTGVGFVGFRVCREKQ